MPRACLAGIALAALTCAPSPAAARGKPTVRSFDTPTAALASILVEKPRVIGFGEYHEIEGGPKVASALRHFTDELLDGIAARSSDLILETWVTEGRCGKKEKEVVAKVEADTERPEATEDELVTLVKRAKAGGVQPHILTMSCVEYLTISDGKGGVDYVRLLFLITDLLWRQVESALDEHKRVGPKIRSVKPGGEPVDKLVLVYGGALHNDVYPDPQLSDYTYAPSVRKKTRDHYLEVDLYVPEFIERDKRIPRESWYPLLAHVESGKTALVKRGPHSYILVFARSPAL